MKEPKRGGKKSFSTDLDSALRQTLFEDNLRDKPTMLLQDANKTKADKKSSTSTQAKEEVRTSSKSPRKSFSDNMDLLFKEGIEELLEGTSVTQIKRSLVQDQGRKAIGIDVLLRRTAPPAPENENEAPDQEPLTKRVTFVVDTEKIETLKEIARYENKRLRHIFTELIEQYIKTHLPGKGN